MAETSTPLKLHPVQSLTVSERVHMRQTDFTSSHSIKSAIFVKVIPSKRERAGAMRGQKQMTCLDIAGAKSLIPGLT